MKETNVLDGASCTDQIVVRMPKDLIARIDDAAGRELLTRSAHVRRTLNAVYPKPAEGVA